MADINEMLFNACYVGFSISLGILLTVVINCLPISIEYETNTEYYNNIRRRTFTELKSIQWSSKSFAMKKFKEKMSYDPALTNKNAAVENYTLCNSMCREEPSIYDWFKPDPIKNALKYKTDAENEWKKTAKMWENTFADIMQAQPNIPEEKENTYKYNARDYVADIYQEYFENMVGCDDIDLTWESTKELTMKPVERAAVITPHIKHMYKMCKRKAKGLFA